MSLSRNKNFGSEQCPHLEVVHSPQMEHTTTKWKFDELPLPIYSRWKHHMRNKRSVSGWIWSLWHQSLRAMQTHYSSRARQWVHGHSCLHTDPSCSMLMLQTWHVGCKEKIHWQAWETLQIRKKQTWIQRKLSFMWWRPSLEGLFRPQHDPSLWSIVTQDPLC